MRGLRNSIVHDYEGINLKLIWEIIDMDIGMFFARPFSRKLQVKIP
jgi:uncharacterized protein with HEPN domain